MNIGMSMQRQTQYLESTEDIEMTQCLTFRLANEEYGVDIMAVQEIRSWEPVTVIPNTPDFIKGVINLRGIVVPIIDLRKRFGFEKIEYGSSTVVIVVKVQHEGKERTIGMVVDAVSEVYNITQDMVREAPELGSAIDIKYLKGLATIDEKMIILLDIDLLVSSEQLSVQDQNDYDYI